MFKSHKFPLKQNGQVRFSQKNTEASINQMEASKIVIFHYPESPHRPVKSALR